jgi:hypothetical protein
VLGGDVLVLEGLGLVERRLEELPGAPRQPDVEDARGARVPFEVALQRRGDGGDPRPPWR